MYMGGCAASARFHMFSSCCFGQGIQLALSWLSVGSQLALQLALSWLCSFTALFVNMQKIRIYVIIKGGAVVPKSMFYRKNREPTESQL